MSATADTTTDWELRLKEYVSAPLKKLTEYATGANKKMNEVANGMAKAAKSSDVMGREFKRNYNGLENTLSKLEARQKSAFSTKHILGYQRLIERTKAEMEKLNAVTAPPPQVLSRWGLLKNNLSAAASEVPGLSHGMSLIKNPAVLAGAAVFALGAGLKKSVDLAADYNVGMAKINATAQLSTDVLGKLKDRLIEIGSHSGGNFELVPEAYEKILSQTGKVNLSLDITETAVKGAQAGFTEINTVAGALAQTLSVVGEKNTTANEVMDTLLKAKAVGAGEFTDFANYLPQLIAAGNNLSVNFKDTAGMFAYMTAKGQSASDSAMLMQNAFTALQKNEIIKGLGKKGIQLFDAGGSRKNIRDVFTDLAKKLDGMSDKSKTKFFIDIGLNDAQARNAFSVLTSDAGKFKEIMGDVNNALGETDRQLAVTANHARTWGDIGDEMKGWAVNIGDILLPLMDQFVTLINNAAAGWKSLFNGEIFKDKDKYKQEKYIIDYNLSKNKARELTEQKFGKGASMDYSTQSGKFYDKWQTEFMKGLSTTASKNNIDKKESATEKALSNVNKGKPAGDTSTSSNTSKSGATVSDSNKVRNLTQNLYITNVIKVDQDTNMDKVKQKFTDLIVDAGRDGITTLGV